MTKTFAGRPILGDITRTSTSSVEQYPIEQFADEVTSALEEFPDVDALVFVGYTPYFNDGDPCVYSVDFRGIVCGCYNYDVEAYDVNVIGTGEEVDYDVTVEMFDEAKHIIDPLSKTFSWSHMRHYCDAMLSTFGDHATIYIYRDRVEVECYEHE